MQALKDHKIKPVTDLIKYTKAREEDGFKTALNLLQTTKRVDAIFTSNSLLASGTLLAIHESKISIPDEIAIASFDDTTWARLVMPSLTVIDQLTFEISRTATEMLIKRIQDPSRSQREVVLNTKMIVRESSGCRTQLSSS